MGNSDNAVVIELDWAPATLEPLRSSDYVERCVVSALHSPVLELESASGPFDRFEFVVADGCRFSDGSAVHADHVLETLSQSASSPLWARFIRYLGRAETVGDRIALDMRDPANFYPAMLEAVDFAPIHPGGRLGNGPYRVAGDFNAEGGYYHLTPNEYFPGASERPELVFVVRTDVDGAPDRFRHGEVDITCGTAFPLGRLGEWQGSSALHRAPTGIHMQLEPNLASGAPLAEPSVRIALLESLDLAGIATSFAGGLRPHPLSPRRSEQGIAIPSRLRISYNDFYPNRQILEKIAVQWRDRLGVDTELVERDYADTSTDDADAAFVLRYPAFKHPYARFDQYATLMADPAFDRLLLRFAAGETGSRRAVVTHLRATVPILRLFEVIGHWLANPRVVGFSWPSDAVFDFTRLRRLAVCPS